MPILVWAMVTIRMNELPRHKTWTPCTKMDMTMATFFSTSSELYLRPPLTIMVDFHGLNSNTIPMINVRRKIICKRFSRKQGKKCWYFSKLLKIKLHWVMNTHTQYKVYFAYLFFNYWNFGILNLKISKFVFKIK